MSGKRQKKLRKEYRKIADEAIQGDVKMLTDSLVKKVHLFRNSTIFLFVLLVLSVAVNYAVIF